MKTFFLPPAITGVATIGPVASVTVVVASITVITGITAIVVSVVTPVRIGASGGGGSSGRGGGPLLAAPDPGPGVVVADARVVTEMAERLRDLFD